MWNDKSWRRRSAPPPHQEGSVISELSKRIELSNEPNMLPGFRYDERQFCFLNAGFDVEIGGMTYHLSSEFSGRGEMSAVIETIELERNRREKLLL